jgi:hypothetical protein
MGHYAALNIRQQIQQGLHGTTLELLHWSEVPPMIALAVGRKAMMYSPADGTSAKT